MIEIVPDRQDVGYQGSVLVAFGRNADLVNVILQRSLAQDPELAPQSTSEFWENWLANARIDHVPDPEIQEFMRRSLITLTVLTDRQTGAIVRSPAARPPLARDWPRHSAWISYCYDLAGYPDLAEGHARFLSRLVRNEGRRSKPYGSLPSTVYADGIEASPHLIIDVEAVAWTLWSYRQHAQTLSPDLRKSFLLEMWPAVSMMSDFLATWRSERTGAALRTYDPSILRERPSHDAMVSARLGLASAIAIAEVLDRAVSPEWNRRVDELDVFVRNMCLDESLRWRVDEVLPFSLLDVLPLQDARFENAAQERLRALDTLSGVDAARALCEVAMLWQGDPEKLAQLRPYIKPTYKNVFYSQPENGSGRSEVLNAPDALAAAQAFIAAYIVFSADAS